MEEIQHIIGNNLMKFRKQRGLSLDHVSELTGVSKAMLAQIEKGKSSPTVTTLWKIANGLNISFSEFIKEDKPDVRKVHIEDLNAITDDEEKYRVYPFFPYHPEKKFEIYIVTLESGCVHEAKTHLGEEYLLMKEGELTIKFQDEEHLLSSGDALNFMGNLSHSYMNTSAQPASFFLLMYYSE
ncbi:helix-turn-helix domain-containing protein [Priestia filamentosa]|uniref:helix-turn-helix domain-containing protein n=1 Tax=Priestia filamentosa TaxID=1402861 RepID=UPI002E1F49B4|nr:helix-turn-helix domain-containing protein [Priestia filamentosa]